MRSPLLSSAFCAIAIGAFARDAQAADTVTKPAPGVTYLLRTTATPNRIHALTVDLCAPGVRVRATPPEAKGKTVSSFAKSIKATAAINGGFFELGTYAPSGLAIGDGKRWSGSKDDSYASFIAFGPNMADLPDQKTTVANPPAWMKHVVSGVQQLVKDGKAVTDFNCAHSGAPCTKAPRTSVGMSEDRRKLFMVVVDGRSAASTGMTLKELAPVMAKLGAHDAINLDGGGSSELWLEGKVKNTPSDGSERVVSNHLAVIADGTGPAEHCNANANANGDPPETPAAGDGTAAPAAEEEDEEEPVTDEDATEPASSKRPTSSAKSPASNDAAAPAADDAEGGCNTSGRAPPLAPFALVPLFAFLRRRRREAPRG